MTTKILISGPWLFAGVQCDIHLIPLEEYTRVEDELNPRVDDVLRPKVKFVGHKGWILDMNVLGNYLYSGSDDRTIMIWDLDRMKRVDVFKAHSDGISCLEFSHEKLYTGSFDHTIKYWDIKEIRQRVIEREMMIKEDIRSRKVELLFSL